MNTPTHTTHMKPQAPKTLLSRDPNRAMQEVMDTIDALRGIYEDETQALLSADTKSFLSLQDEKLRRARAYQLSIEEMLTRKNEMRDVNQDLKRKLEKMQKDFSELAHENKVALERMQRTVDRLNGTIRGAVKDAVKQQRGVAYNQIGRLEDGGAKKSISGSLSETA